MEISHEDESRLMKYTKEAMALVSSGTHPTDAIEKISRQNKLSPDTISILSAAYNNGRQLAQWKSGKSAFDKLADFPLASAQDVISRIYDDKEVTAEVDDFYRDDSWVPRWRDVERWQVRNTPVRLTTKTANTVQPLQTEKLDQIREYQNAGKALSALRTKVAEAEDAVRRAIGGVTNYFRSLPIDRHRFEDVEYAAVTYLGKEASHVFDLVYDRNQLLHQRHKEKRASELTKPPVTNIGPDSLPLRLVSNCLDTAIKFAQIRSEYKKQEHSFGDMKKAIHPQRVDITEPEPAGELTPKLAFLGPAIGMSAGKLLAESVPKTRGELIESYADELNDPEHDQQLRSIRVRAMLNQLMTDPDDPISSYHPDEVLDAYNEIAQLSPRLADKPLAMRPWLRRRLGGQLEPFETKELVDIEKSRAQSQSKQMLGADS